VAFSPEGELEDFFKVGFSGIGYSLMNERESENA
jgi:hypothetical protein